MFEDDAPLQLAARARRRSRRDGGAGAPRTSSRRADVLRAGDPLGFTHPLVRAAVYGELPLGERARTHRRAARLLADGGAPGEQVSAHLLESPPAGDAVVVGVLRAAAQRALPRARRDSAVGYLERALREPPPEPTRRGACSPSSGAPRRSPGGPRPLAHLEAAIELVAEPRERAALLLDVRPGAAPRAAALDEASASFRRGLDELGADARSELAVDLEARLPDRPRCTRPSARPTRTAAADAILAGRATSTSRAGRALASKAMIMRLFAGAPRDEVLAVARRLLRRRPPARGGRRRLAGARRT